MPPWVRAIPAATSSADQATVGITLWTVRAARAPRPVDRPAERIEYAGR